MARILVTEPLSERGLAALREAGHNVEVALDLSPSNWSRRSGGPPR